jgi:hypothetical protein
MPARLTLSQRLTGPDGLPTLGARLGVAGLMLLAAGAGYAATSAGRDAAAPAPRALAADRLAGELPIATPEPEPALAGAAALPPLHARPRARRERRAPVRRPVATPAPAATPAPGANVPVSDPVPAPTPAAPAPAAPPAAAPPAAAPPARTPAVAPRPRSTPAPTFDSSG